MRTINRGNIRFNVADDHVRVSDEMVGGFWDSFSSGTWEPSTVAMLEKLIQPGMQVLDIGAWRGPVTLIASSRGAIVHAFEPDPVAFAALEANVKANDPELVARIHLHNLAVTHDGTPIKLFTRWAFGDSGSSILPRLRDSGASVQVTSTTFDQAVSDAGLDRIDFIKMDIEGGEFHLLPGMRGALERFKPVLRVAVHYPYLVEHFQKMNAPRGWRRRLKKVLAGSGKKDARASAEQQARVLFDRFAGSLSGFPYLYDHNLRPIEREALFERVQELTELVFSYEPLRR